MKNETFHLAVNWVVVVLLLAGFILHSKITDAYEAKLKEAKEYCVAIRGQAVFCEKISE